MLSGKSFALTWQLKRLSKRQLRWECLTPLCTQRQRLITRLTLSWLVLPILNQTATTSAFQQAPLVKMYSRMACPYLIFISLVMGWTLRQFKPALTQGSKRWIGKLLTVRCSSKLKTSRSWILKKIWSSKMRTLLIIIILTQPLSRNMINRFSRMDHFHCFSSLWLMEAINTSKLSSTIMKTLFSKTFL